MSRTRARHSLLTPIPILSHSQPPALLSQSRMQAEMHSDSLEHQRTLQDLALVLERICQGNGDMRADSPTVFDAVTVPAMSIHCYLVRMRRYTKFDFSCFLIAMTYLDRLCFQGTAYCPTMHNIHRLLVTALLVASKASDGGYKISW